MHLEQSADHILVDHKTVRIVLSFTYSCCSCFQEYLFPLAREREYLITMHRKAKRLNFDVDTYNRLRTQLFQVDMDLKRLRDPLNARLHLPYIPPKPHNQNDSNA